MSLHDKIKNYITAHYKVHGSGMLDELTANIIEGCKVPWISVEDRLPEDMKEVLVIFKCLDIPMVGFYSKTWNANRDYVNSDGYVFSDCDEHEVTHWQPLPDKP